MNARSILMLMKAVFGWNIGKTVEKMGLKDFNYSPSIVMFLHGFS